MESIFTAEDLTAGQRLLSICSFTTCSTTNMLKVPGVTERRKVQFFPQRGSITEKNHNTSFIVMCISVLTHLEIKFLIQPRNAELLLLFVSFSSVWKMDPKVKSKFSCVSDQNIVYIYIYVYMYYMQILKLA